MTRTLATLKEEVLMRLNGTKDSSVLHPDNWHRQFSTVKINDNKGVLYYIDIDNGIVMNSALVNIVDWTYTSDQTEIREFIDKYFPKVESKKVESIVEVNKDKHGHI